MRILVIGGTRFIGPALVRALVRRGHEVAVFHRGVTEADLPASVRHFHGERAAIDEFRDAFRSFRVETAIDLSAYTAREAAAAARALTGLAGRLVVASSADVYRAFGLVQRLESGAPEPMPVSEEAALRTTLYPYRAMSAQTDDRLRDYEKIHVEREAQANPELPATVLRLPAVYGPGDYQHRLWPYLSRMLDGRPAIPIDAGLADWRWTRGYVDDVVHALELAGVHPAAGGRVYNVGEPDALTEREWIDRIARVVGWSGRIVSIEPRHLPPPLRLPFDWQHQMIVDSGRIRRELGYAERTDPTDAMRRTVEWERASPPAQSSAVDYEAEDRALA